MAITETHFAAAPKILVLGATGPTGRYIVSQAVSRGYDVIVLVRSPEKAADMKGAKIVVGDARDETVLRQRSEEHTSELQSLMRISYAVFCLNKNKTQSLN